MSGTVDQHPGIPEERRFVWRNLDAFLTGELSEADRARIEAFLCECPYTKEYVETEQQFAAAVHRCVSESPVECPKGLRERILTALDRCELDDDVAAGGALPPAGNVLRFPWLGVVMMAAASIMLVVALMLLNSPQQTSNPDADLQAGLAPMVSRLSLDCPRGGKCLFDEADEQYRETFADAAGLPHAFDGAMMKVADFKCVKLDGRPVMCAVYDSPDGERFGFMVFCDECVEGAVPAGMQAAELVVNGHIVLMWREGAYIRALVGDNHAALQRHMSELRKTV